MQKKIKIFSNRYFQSVIVFISCFVSQMLIYCCENYVTMIEDRIGDLATPSYLAGLDWADLLSQTNYYGYGMKWLLFIFFKITDDPYLIYLWTLIFYAVLISVFYSVIYLSISSTIKERLTLNGLMIILPVMACIYSYHPMSSEPTLFFAMQVLAIILIELEKSVGVKKGIYSAITAFWLIYMLTLHERSLAVVFAFCMIVVADRLLSKKFLVDLRVFLPSVILFYIGKKILTDRIIDFFWGNSTVKNTSALPSISPLVMLTSFKHIQVVVTSVLSNITCLVLKTYGLYFIVLLIVLVFAWNILSRKFDREDYLKYRVYYIIAFVSFLSLMITLAGLSLKSNRIPSGNMYGYKNFTYVRYYMSWIPVGIISSWVIFSSDTKAFPAKVRIALATVYCLLFKWFYSVMLPVLEEANEASMNIATGNNFRFYQIGIFENTAVISASDYRMNILISFAITIAVVIFLFIDAKQISYIGLAVIFAAMVVNQTSAFKLKPMTFTSTQDVYYRAVQKISETETISPDVYCTEGAETRVFTLQYILNRYSVHNSFPGKDVPENTMVVTWFGDETFEKSLTNNDFVRHDLGDGYYIWFKKGDFDDRVSQILA
nr:hypothetical protein [Lachnospiraceae bacterium]